MPDKHKILEALDEIQVRLDAIRAELAGPTTADSTQPPPQDTPPEGPGGN